MKALNSPEHEMMRRLMEAPSHRAGWFLVHFQEKTDREMLQRLQSHHLIEIYSMDSAASCRLTASGAWYCAKHFSDNL